MLTSQEILRLDLRNIELRRRVPHGLPRLGAALYVCSLHLTFLETKEPLHHTKREQGQLISM